MAPEDAAASAQTPGACGAIAVDFRMRTILDAPLAVFALSLVAMWLSALSGAFLRNRIISLDEDERKDLGIVVPATLTLAGLMIGFSFSMATNRYDQRKNYEAEEANAMGTEYVRADLLSASDAARVRELLKSYPDQRILFYETRDAQQLRSIDRQTAPLQSELWAILQAAAAKKSTPPVSRAVFSMMLIGYSSHRRGISVFLVLPLVVSVSLFLIADIESPPHGLIFAMPENLVSLAPSLRAQ